MRHREQKGVDFIDLPLRAPCKARIRRRILEATKRRIVVVIRQTETILKYLRSVTNLAGIRQSANAPPAQTVKIFLPISRASSALHPNQINFIKIFPSAKILFLRIADEADRRYKSYEKLQKCSDAGENRMWVGLGMRMKIVACLFSTSPAGGGIKLLKIFRNRTESRAKCWKLGGRK